MKEFFVVCRHPDLYYHGEYRFAASVDAAIEDAHSEPWNKNAERIEVYATAEEWARKGRTIRARVFEAA